MVTLREQAGEIESKASCALVCRAGGVASP